MKVKLTFEEAEQIYYALDAQADVMDRSHPGDGFDLREWDARRQKIMDKMARTIWALAEIELKNRN
jgi:hypothetical protein